MKSTIVSLAARRGVTITASDEGNVPARTPAPVASTRASLPHLATCTERERAVSAAMVAGGRIQLRLPLDNIELTETHLEMLLTACENSLNELRKAKRVGVAQETVLAVIRKRFSVINRMVNAYHKKR